MASDEDPKKSAKEGFQLGAGIVQTILKALFDAANSMMGLFSKSSAKNNPEANEQPPPHSDLSDEFPDDSLFEIDSDSNPDEDSNKTRKKSNPILVQFQDKDKLSPKAFADQILGINKQRTSGDPSLPRDPHSPKSKSPFTPPKPKPK